MSLIQTMTINIDQLLEPAIKKLKGDIQAQLKEMALKMVEDEVAKFSIELSRFVSVQSFASEIRITIHKDMLEKQEAQDE